MTYRICSVNHNVFMNAVKLKSIITEGIHFPHTTWRALLTTVCKPPFYTTRYL